MTDSFGAQLLTLPQIFDGRFFEIPDYQRSYTWESDQVKDLLADIQHLLTDRKSMLHFTGTLVMTPSSNQGRSVYQVVDGQQRLTTLSIVVAVLRDGLSAESTLAVTARYFSRGPKGKERQVLRLNQDTRDYFQRTILAPAGSPGQAKETLQAHGRLKEARRVIREWLADHDASKVLAVVESKLGFLLYAPEKSAEVGVMFEVINNRGKPLSELEKVKNYLIYCCARIGASTTREKVDQAWSRILSELNRAGKTSAREEAAFLRYCCAVHLRLSKERSQYGYDELKKAIGADIFSANDEQQSDLIQAIEEFVSFLEQASRWYAALYGQVHEGEAREFAEVLGQIRAQDQQASIMPLVLAVLVTQKLSGARKLELLRLLEILNFRVYLARGITARNDSGQAELFRYAALFFHEDLAQNFNTWDWRPSDAADDFEALKLCLVAFVEKCAPEVTFRESFVLSKHDQFDFYRWGGLRYFLMSYEQHLQPHKTIQIDRITQGRKDGKSGDFLSVEHLWGQSFRPKKNNRVEDSRERRRLGNFVLLELRLNIQGGKGFIGDKIQRYSRGFDKEPSSDLQQVKNVTKDVEKALRSLGEAPRTKNYYLKLHETINDNREERLIKFAIERWSLSD